MSLIVGSCLLCFNFLLPIDDLVMSNINSPDGKYVAVICVHWGGGILGDVTTEVSLKATRGIFKNKTSVFEEHGLIFVDVFWADSSNLLITYYPQKENIFKSNMFEKKIYKKINVFYKAYGNKSEIEKYSKIQYIPILDKQTYKLGESIYMKVYIENRSNSTLQFDSFLYANCMPWFIVESYLPSKHPATSKFSTKLTKKLNLGISSDWKEATKCFYQEFNKKDIIIMPKKKYLLFEGKIEK